MSLKYKYLVMGSSVRFLLVFVLGLNLFPGTAWARDKGGVVIENAEMHLIIGLVRLVHKASGRECLCSGVSAPAFSITQYQPYDDKLQLKYLSSSKIFAADLLYHHGRYLVVSLDLVNIVATIGLKINYSSIGFTLEKLDHHMHWFGDKLKTSVDELVLMQLPGKDRQNFGE